MPYRGVSLPHTRHEMRDASGQIHDLLQDFVTTITPEPSLEGAICCLKDSYHPDAAVITRANSARLSKKLGKFQMNNIANRRIDLATTTIGETFNEGTTDDDLRPSQMNPGQHSVFGIYLPESQGVVQLAFTDGEGAQKPKLDKISREFTAYQSEIEKRLGQISLLSQYAVNGSVSDMLELDIPTTPNAALIGWDISESSEASATNYPQLRTFLLEHGEDVRQRVEAHPTAHMISETDGQLYRVNIPLGYNPNLRQELGYFVSELVSPIVTEISDYFKVIDRIRDYNGDPRYPVRIAAEVGHIEKMPAGPNGPLFWELQGLNKDLSRNNSVVAAIGPRAAGAARLTRHGVFILA